MRVGFASLLLLGFAMPVLAGRFPSLAVQRRITPVFDAYGQIRVADTERSATLMDAALKVVLEDQSPVGDEALAVLAGFYLGEHSAEDIGCELVTRGSRVLPYLTKYQSKPAMIHGISSEARRRADAYSLVIKRITAGEHCVREP